MVEIYNLMKELFPVMKSITGEGNRVVLNTLKKIIPIEIMEVPTGTQVFDWKVPREWNCRDAWIKNSKGEKIIELGKSNLHVVNYSVPFKGVVSFDELKNHLYTLPRQPDKIPYITSYYKERWGFCLKQEDLDKMDEGDYEVLIDSELKGGSLSFGEIYIPGEKKEEILFSSYICHPSQCNDSLSGVALCVFLAKSLLEKKNKYSYRFLFIPETIGAITWLSLNEEKVKNILGGFVVTCVGDSGEFTYKKTRSGNHFIDFVSLKVLNEGGSKFKVREFNPSDGSDERQYSSPGFNIQMGSLMRTMYGEFKEYHNSGDNLDFVSSESLDETFEMYKKIIGELENNKFEDYNVVEETVEDGEKYLSLNPKCEPQLGRRGLYGTMGGRTGVEFNEAVIFWMLNFSDGKHTLDNISKKSGINLDELKGAASVLVERDLIKKME